MSATKTEDISLGDYLSMTGVSVSLAPGKLGEVPAGCLVLTIEKSGDGETRITRGIFEDIGDDALTVFLEIVQIAADFFSSDFADWCMDFDGSHNHAMTDTTCQDERVMAEYECVSRMARELADVLGSPDELVLIADEFGA